MVKPIAAVVSVLLLLAPAGAISFSRGDGPTASSAEDKLVALQPVLEKLKSLDPKTFGMLNGMITQAESKGAPHAAFLQYLRESPDEVEAKMERLAPILDKLKSLDGKTFGALSGLMSQAAPSAGSGAAAESWEGISGSLAAATQDPSVMGAAWHRHFEQAPAKSWDRPSLTAAPQDSSVLGVALARQRGVEEGSSKDGEGTVVDIKLASELQEKESFLQSSALRKAKIAPGVEDEVAKEKQEDVYIHDEFAAHAAEDAKQEKEVRLAQTPRERAVLAQKPNEEALQQVLGKLKGLDGKAFGMLSSMIAQAEASAKH
mmetsp:Transcript_35700/g.65501  ORF Transcript_35700/g.65501 Transcript_35700/m.65501 type:complete len:317 (-) Transcript_35700:49-999(-)